MTQKYLKYEDKLMNEYRRQIRKLEMTRAEKDATEKNEVINHISRELHSQFMYFEPSEGHF